VRIGHFAERKCCSAGVIFIDESEVLTPADEENSHWKQITCVRLFAAPHFGRSLRRIAEGAAMIRTKGEAGSGTWWKPLRHMRRIVSQMKKLTHHARRRVDARSQRAERASRTGSPDRQNRQAAGAEFFRGRHCHSGRRSAGEAPRARKRYSSDRASSSPANPEVRAKAVVKAATHFEDANVVLEAHEELGEAMRDWTFVKWKRRTCLSTRGW